MNALINDTQYTVDTALGTQIRNKTDMQKFGDFMARLGKSYEGGRSSQSSIEKLDPMVVGWEAVRLYISFSPLFESYLQNYPYLKSFEISKVSDLWVTFSAEGVTIDNFVGAIREVVMDHDAINMTNLNRKLKKPVRLKLERSVETSLKRRGLI